MFSYATMCMKDVPYSPLVRGSCIQHEHCLFIDLCRNCRSPNASFSFQYYALQILETVIKTRWKILPRNQCEGEFNFGLGCYLLLVLRFLEIHPPRIQEAEPSSVTVVTCGCQVGQYPPFENAVFAFFFCCWL